MNRSRAVVALIDGTPRASRVTVTSASRPGSVRAPLTCGRGRRTSAVTPRVVATRITTTTTAVTVTTVRRNRRRATRTGYLRGPARTGDGRAGRVLGHRRGRRTVTMCGAPCARSRPDGQPRRTMPTYAYRCTACDHAFEIHQAFTDDALTTCPECSGALRKLFTGVGVVFKGSGFYRTDSR